MIIFARTFNQGKMRTASFYQSFIPVLVFWMISVEHKVGGYTSTYIMLEGDCPGPSILFVHDSVQVSLISNPLRYNQRTRKRCSLTFQAQKNGHHLLLHWDALRLAPLIGSMNTRVFLRGGRSIPTHDEGRTDDQRRDYLSIHNQITLYYSGFPHFDYLKVTVTEIRPSRECGPAEFLCQRIPEDFCISNDLLCNGENNCGDSNVSDENNRSCMKSQVTTSSPTETPLPVGLVGALAAQPFIIAFLVGAFYIIRMRRQKAKREADLGADLQRRAPTSLRLRSQNEYVTLPKSSSCMQHKEPELSTLQIRPLSADTQRAPRALPPRRMLPPTPEEPEPNYINLHEAPQLPLLFQVPDVNSVPLFHTTGLRKPLVQSCPSREPEVSISEPGYVEIDDVAAEVIQTSDSDRKDAVLTDMKSTAGAKEL